MINSIHGQKSSTLKLEERKRWIKTKKKLLIAERTIILEIESSKPYHVSEFAVLRVQTTKYELNSFEDAPENPYEELARIRLIADICDVATRNKMLEKELINKF